MRLGLMAGRRRAEVHWDIPAAGGRQGRPACTACTALPPGVPSQSDDPLTQPDMHRQTSTVAMQLPHSLWPECQQPCLQDRRNAREWSWSSLILKRMSSIIGPQLQAEYSTQMLHQASHGRPRNAPSCSLLQQNPLPPTAWSGCDRRRSGRSMLAAALRQAGTHIFVGFGEQQALLHFRLTWQLSTMIASKGGSQGKRPPSASHYQEQARQDMQMQMPNWQVRQPGMQTLARRWLASACELSSNAMHAARRDACSPASGRQHASAGGTHVPSGLAAWGMQQLSVQAASAMRKAASPSARLARTC